MYRVVPQTKITNHTLFTVNTKVTSNANGNVKLTNDAQSTDTQYTKYTHFSTILFCISRRSSNCSRIRLKLHVRELLLVQLKETSL